jgi:hypothetical protein
MGASNSRLALVVVTWNDAHADAEFHDKASLAKEHVPRRVQSVGILVTRDKKGITLARDFDDAGEYDGRIFIPRGMVVKVRKLKYATERKGGN